MMTSLDFASALRKTGLATFKDIPPIFFVTCEQIQTPKDHQIDEEIRLKNISKGDNFFVPYNHFFLELKTPGGQIWFYVVHTLFDESHANKGLWISIWNYVTKNAIYNQFIVLKDECLRSPPNMLSVNLQTGASVKLDLSDERTNELSSLFNSYVFSFLERLFSPSTHTLKKIPTVPGKSVHWTESRSRIVLVDNQRAATLQKEAGVKLSDEEQKEINRMAHSRRAHARVLRAPRYKANIGKSVFVKACWVGPKEWCDGKAQVLYRLIESRAV